MADENDTCRQSRKIEQASYVFKWYHGSDRRYCWFIRGIKPDRSFWGEITVFIGRGGKQVNVTGCLSESDYARFLSLVKEIETDVGAGDPDAIWDGLLAEGPVSNPRIIFRYRRDSHQTSATGLQFLSLVDVLAPYLRCFYESLQ